MVKRKPATKRSLLDSGDEAPSYVSWFWTGFAHFNLLSDPLGCKAPANLFQDEPDEGVAYLPPQLKGHHCFLSFNLQLRLQAPEHEPPILPRSGSCQRPGWAARHCQGGQDLSFDH